MRNSKDPLKDDVRKAVNMLSLGSSRPTMSKSAQTSLLKIKSKIRYISSRLLEKLGLRSANSAAGLLSSIRRQHFDDAFYLEHNLDVAESGIDPFTHFSNAGYREGRKARLFDNAWYLLMHPDVQKLKMDGHDHYAAYGKKEGRQARYIVLDPESAVSERNNYSKWLAHHKSILSSRPAESEFRTRPKISILMTVYNTDLAHLRAAIESVIEQSYSNWELCIADDASTVEEIEGTLHHYAVQDSRVKVLVRGTNGHISEASNTALVLATGDYTGLLDHDDLLHPDALLWVARAINDNPDGDLFYTDEDKIDETGMRFDPYFKCGFNYELLLAQNMISHFGVYRTALLKGVGGFRKGFEGAQDHDLALRVLDRSAPENIIHIPRVLYHWRASQGSTALSIGEKSYAPAAGRKAVQSHFERKGIAATVSAAPHNAGHYRVRYDLPLPPPLISIIIATRDRADILKVCIDSISARSTYKNYEIVIIDNGSREASTHAYFEKLRNQGVRIYENDIEFNFSALNNFGVGLSNGEYVCLLNNDVEIITPDWLEELISFAQMPDIGCVGARLWYPDRTLQHGGVVLGIGGVAGHAHKGLPEAANGYFCRAVHHQSYSAVTAACLMIRKSVFAQVGGLDENLAVAFNDVDFCLRVLAEGYRNVWTPYAELFHYESASRGAEKTLAQQSRFAGEVEYMKYRWSESLADDPAYSPNLTLEHEDYSYAWPPRLSR